MISGYGRYAAELSMRRSYHDWYFYSRRRLFETRLRHQPRCFLGRDAVGIVMERGSAVQSGLQLGARVAVASLPIHDSGYWAEYATAPAHDCALLPDSVPTQTAAALPYAALTVLQSLQHRVFKGSRVLVHGGINFHCPSRLTACRYLLRTRS